MSTIIAEKPTETPMAIAHTMVNIAKIKKGDDVLEPSAGFGKLALAAKAIGANITVIELNQHCYNHLMNLNMFESVVHADFLRYTPVKKFDAIIMCPPRNAVPHIEHAYSFLKPNGILVALVRRDSNNISKYIDNYAELPYNSFVMDGKNVPSGFVILKGK